jgi:hypothetical protein
MLHLRQHRSRIVALCMQHRLAVPGCGRHLRGKGSINVCARTLSPRCCRGRAASRPASCRPPASLPQPAACSANCLFLELLLPNSAVNSMHHRCSLQGFPRGLKPQSCRVPATEQVPQQQSQKRARTLRPMAARPGRRGSAGCPGSNSSSAKIAPAQSATTCGVASRLQRWTQEQSPSMHG